MSNPLVIHRLKALRADRRLSQDDVAATLGMNDRQSVSAIENGVRPMKAVEARTLMEAYGLDRDYFTDPFRLIGEGTFNWRQTRSSAAALADYQDRAGRWLAAYRELSTPESRPGPAERRSLRLAESSTFESAAAEAERLAVDYAMGDVPAARLPRVMEDDFGILVLMVDMDSRISGAACRLPELDAVLVNRNENPGRRNFDLAHEFFHILTWDRMPPKPIEEASENGGSRVEKLANSFASALLMPRRLVERFGQWRGMGVAEQAHRMREVADHFRVSVTALHWRLVALGFLNKAAQMLEVAAPSPEYLADTPAPFSATFLRVMSDGVAAGRLSAGRLATLLAIPRTLLREVFDAQGIEAPSTI